MRLVRAGVERADHQRTSAQRFGGLPVRRFLLASIRHRRSAHEQELGAEQADPVGAGRDGPRPRRPASRCSPRPRSSSRRSCEPARRAESCASRRAAARPSRAAVELRQQRRVRIHVDHAGRSRPARSASPRRRSSSASPAPTTAGIPDARASTAACDVGPPRGGGDAERRRQGRAPRCRRATGRSRSRRPAPRARVAGSGRSSRRASTWRPTLRRSAARARRYSSSSASQSLAVRSITSCHARAADDAIVGDRIAWSGTGARRRAGTADGRRRSPPRRRPLVPATSVALAGDVVSDRAERGIERSQLDARCRRLRRGSARSGVRNRRAGPIAIPADAGWPRTIPGSFREDGDAGAARSGPEGSGRSSKSRAASAAIAASAADACGPRGRRPRSRGPASHRASRRRSGWTRRRVLARSSGRAP